mmetsp:Transcript_33750/g.79583  ORF Transcript_33750/g.79583 Transcript_33750/m.79583 type:complete len:85 (+) Transcript_33750:155-409(+)
MIGDDKNSNDFAKMRMMLMLMPMLMLMQMPTRKRDDENGRDLTYTPKISEYTQKSGDPKMDNSSSSSSRNMARTKSVGAILNGT